MALLGMQADMPSKSHFPGCCYTSWDLNLDANGNMQPSNNVDRILMTRQYYNGAMSPPSSDLNLWYKYNKDILKQTMLKQEAIFRDQIHELHRLYRRQRELMDEMKRHGLHKHHQNLEALQLNHVLLPKSFGFLQEICHPSSMQSMNQLPLSNANNIISPLHFMEGNGMQAGSHLAPVEGSSINSELLESKCKKFGKKILDLELPAYEYIDSEEEEFLETKRVDDATQVPSYPVKTISATLCGSDKEQLASSISCNSQKDNASPSTISSKTKILADLNIPINFEEEIAPEFGELSNPVTGHTAHLCQGDKRNSLDSCPQELCSEKSSNSLEHIENRQAQECITCNVLDEHGRKSCNVQSTACEFSGNSNAGSVAAFNKSSSCHIVPLVDPANAESSSVSSWRRCEFMRTPIAVQAFPCFNMSTALSKGSKSSTSTESPRLAGRKLHCHEKMNSMSPSCSTDVADSMDVSSMDAGTILKNPTEVSPLVDKKTTSARNSCKRSRKSIPMESVLLEANSEFIHDVELEKVEESKSFSNDMILEKENMKENVIDGIPNMNLESDGKRFQSCRVIIDLNSCIDEDESQPMLSHSTEIDLEAPASPENKERSPPRGESDGNQVETPLPTSGQEDLDLQEELVKIAAEAIVNISSFSVQSCLESNSCEPSKTLQIDYLYWFARVASSVVDDPDSEFGINTNVDDHGDNGYISSKIDYFEAMTLQLEEIKVDEFYFETMKLKLKEMKGEFYGNIEKEEEKNAASLPIQPRRGRTRRGRQQRKDFQSEILPSLASLSRYEVSEDLQLIGGLMEAAGGHWESGSSRTAGRYGGARGRRQSYARASNTMETKTNLLLKKNNGSPEVGIKERRSIDWGKITRRPRGPRIPSSNSWLILGRV
ncbi:hypothetical protein SLA2020_003870 [Shorea laevis]